jgi:hypothetical protein
MTFRRAFGIRILLGVPVSFILIVVAWQNSAAQVNTGTILGTVKDRSGAVLPGASVTVTNTETGIGRSAVAGERGEYRIPALAIGNYEVQAELPGFQTAIRKGITLSVGQEAVIDISLNVGNVAEHVTVEEQAPLLETTTATVSGLVDPGQMREIPLNARSFIELVPLQSGAVFDDAASGSATNGFGKKVSITGSRYESNVFLLDGADLNDAAGSAGSAIDTVAGVETVQEFRVITNAYDAEYGRHTGGVITAVTKSGTNQFHGSLFEFLRNSSLDAARWEDNQSPNGKPPLKRNQFGGSFGGPLKKDKTFFFGSYEGLRQRRGFTQIFNVPGFMAQSGLSPTATPQPIKPEIQSYLTLWPRPNVLCTSRCVAAQFQSRYPFDRSDGTGQYITSFTEPSTQNYWMVRTDHRFSDSDSIFGRVTFDSADKSTPAGNGFNTTSVATTKNRFITIEETHIFSPALISRTMASFNRTNLNLHDDYLSGFTPPRFNFSDSPNVPGILTVTSIQNWGGTNTSPKADVQNNYQFKQDFILSKGQHSLKFGWQTERFQFNEVSDFYRPGQYDFNSIGSFVADTPTAAHFIRPGSDDIRGWRQSLTGLYVQEDINVRPGLTVNAGVRYEFISVPTEANGKVATIHDLSPGHFNSVLPSQTDTGDPYFVNPSLKNFAPRVGIAWTPLKKTVVRTGAGIFFEQILSDKFITAGDRMPPYFAVSELFSQNIGIDFPNAFVAQRDKLIQNVGSLPQADGFPYRPDQPTVMKWSTDIQQQIAPDTTIDIGYSGTRGYHLFRGNLNLNSTQSTLINGKPFLLITQRTNNPAWARMRWRLTDGTSNYHALRLELTKRFSHSFQLQSSYTYSRSTDDSSSRNGGTDFGSSDLSGYLGAKLHGLSSFDVRNSFFTNFIYDLPGRNWKGAAGALLGGWSTSSILRFNSGYPLNLSATTPSVTLTDPATGRATLYGLQNTDGSFVNLVPGGKNNPVHPQNPAQYFDTSQFAPVVTNCMNLRTPTGTSPCNAGMPVGLFFGNLGRNVLIGPGVSNVDFTLNKQFSVPKMGEMTKLQFRAEAYNLFNRVNFDPPALRLFDANGVPVAGAGQITSTLRHNPRQLQLALKLTF